jgi:death on curing protein
MPEISWISKELTCVIHDRQLAIHGGMAGIRDEGLLSSALARPQNLFAYSDPKPDLAQLAAAYAYGL